jgi:hypothetical protein
MSLEERQHRCLNAAFSTNQISTGGFPICMKSVRQASQVVHDGWGQNAKKFLFESRASIATKPCQGMKIESKRKSIYIWSENRIRRIMTVDGTKETKVKGDQLDSCQRWVGRWIALQESRYVKDRARRDSEEWGRRRNRFEGIQPVAICKVHDGSFSAKRWQDHLRAALRGSTNGADCMPCRFNQ